MVAQVNAISDEVGIENLQIEQQTVQHASAARRGWRIALEIEVSG